MTRVLFLTESFHPVLGGGERHIRALGRDLARTGTPVTVVTRRGDEAWPAEETFEGMHVVRVPPPGPGRSGKYHMVPHALAALHRLRRRYDVLIVRGTRVLGLPGIVAARAAGKRVILQPEVNGEMSGEVYTWGQPFAGTALDRAIRAGTGARNLFLRDADAFVAMSHRIREEFLAAGVPSEKVAHIPHGVDTARFHPASAAERGAARSRFGLPADACVIAYTGRLLRGKGLEDLVAAFAKVAAEVPSAHLLVVGSGAGQALSVEEDLRARVAREGLGARVTFTGALDDVSEALRAADVFAFPSVFEALGISLIEAAATGLPAVGARTGGIVDVIEDGGSGWLVDPGDLDALAARLRALVLDAS
ncbi:MAG TPA: glycosyltransferase family 4 protein, partial [Vicinamibacteria bacterium]|nr:glycosyltransferase family 4 protein [Vicinamibacteria bacterium]